MTKKELVEKIKNKCQGNQCKEKITEIEIKLDCIPDNYPFENLNSVKTYIDTVMPPQLVTQEKILSEVDYEISKVIKNRVKEKEHCRKREIDNNRHVGMWIFLSVILALTAIAIACLIVGLAIKADSEAAPILEKLGTAFGFGDFALGAVGFVWERITDMKNEAQKEMIHEKSEFVMDAISSAELVETTKEFVEVVSVKNSNNKNVQKGKTNVIVNGDISGKINIGDSLFD